MRWLRRQYADGPVLFSHHERELIVERTWAGLAAARAEGRVGGRRPKLSQDEWAQMGETDRRRDGQEAGCNHFRRRYFDAVQKIPCVRLMPCFHSACRRNTCCGCFIWCAIFVSHVVNRHSISYIMCH